jgi:hypothetical protein
MESNDESILKKGHLAALRRTPSATFPVHTEVWWNSRGQETRYGAARQDYREGRYEQLVRKVPDAVSFFPKVEVPRVGDCPEGLSADDAHTQLESCFLEGDEENLPAALLLHPKSQPRLLLKRRTGDQVCMDQLGEASDEGWSEEFRGLRQSTGMPAELDPRAAMFLIPNKVHRTIQILRTTTGCFLVALLVVGIKGAPVPARFHY